MNKETLLKEIFEYYKYNYEVCTNGAVKEFNEDGGYTLYDSIDEALKEWVDTMENTNADIYQNGDVEEEYNTWSKESIDFIRSLI